MDVIPVWENEQEGILEAALIDGEWLTPAAARARMLAGEDCVIHGPMNDEDGNDRETFTPDCLGCIWAALYADPSCAG